MPSEREVRTARILLVLIPSMTLVLAIATRLIITSDAVSRAIAFEIAGNLANRSRSAVQLSGVTFGWDFAPCFQDIELYRFHGPFKIKAATKRACVDRWASALGSGFRAVRIQLEEPVIELEGSPDQKERASFVDVKPSAEGSDAESRRTLHELEIVFDELRLRWNGMPFPERFAAGSFGPIDGHVTVQLRGQHSAMSVAIRDPATGSALNGRATPTEEGWDMSIGVEGDLVPIFGNLLAAAELDIRRLPTRGRLGLRYGAKERMFAADVDLQQLDADVANTIVSSKRLQGFDAREKFRIAVNLAEQSLSVQDGVVEINNIPLDFSVSLESGETSPTFATRIDLRTTPFIRLLRAVPGAREPALASDIPPRVAFALSFSMSGVLKDPATWEPKLEYRFQGIGEDGEGGGLRALRNQFAYYPLTVQGRQEEPRIVGPETRNWVSYDDIPYLLRRAVIVSEDASFSFHNGLDVESIRQAVRSAIETGERARGGSTISQQLVKNLFLSRDRTALRKAQEALLTFHMEEVLSKEEIFALYMNLIEWGPNVYGIGEASQHYFGRKPKQLRPKEMAYLATIIPNPIAFHEHFESGQVSPRHLAKVDGLLERLNRLGQLPDEELTAAKEARIAFARRPSENVEMVGRSGESP